MQLTNTLCALILAVTVSSAALPNAQPIAAADPEARWGCGERGQPCGKLRRAAEAIAEAVAVPEPEAGWGCGERGQPCGKAKRDALALARAADIVLRTI